MQTAFNQTLLPLGMDAVEQYLWDNMRGTSTRRLPLEWNASADGAGWQKDFLKVLANIKKDLAGIIGHNTFANIDSVKVNDWFQTPPNNFPRLITEKGIDPLVFYVGMVYSLRNLSWIGGDAEAYNFVDGVPFTLTTNRKPAYALTTNKNLVQFFDPGGSFGRPVAVIPTYDTAGEQMSKIAIMAWASEKLDEWGLTSAAQSIADRYARGGLLDTWSGVLLPNISTETTLSLGEGKLKGLWAKAYDGRTVKVEDAGMFLRNKLTMQGPMSEGAAFVEATLESMLWTEEDNRPLLRFDEPFVYAFVDMELSKPTVYTANWVDTDEFSDTRLTLD